jgi:hypothetical protein
MSARYYQLRTPGTGSRPIGANYTQIGADGRLVASPSAGATIVSSISSKVLALWNGSINVAEPTGWTLQAFNDSAWAVAVLDTTDTVHPTPTGATWVSYSNAWVYDYAKWLLRIDFTLSPGAVSAVTLQYNVDDLLLGFWVNGTFITADSSGGLTLRTVTIPTTLLILGGANVIAAEIQNWNSGGGPTGFVSKLAVS